MDSLPEDDRVLTVAEWAARTGVCLKTAYKILHSSDGPRYVQLTSRLYGVTVGENREWQKRRSAGGAR